MSLYMYLEWASQRERPSGGEAFKEYRSGSDRSFEAANSVPTFWELMFRSADYEETGMDGAPILTVERVVALERLVAVKDLVTSVAYGMEAASAAQLFEQWIDLVATSEMKYCLLWGELLGDITADDFREPSEASIKSALSWFAGDMNEAALLSGHQDPGAPTPLAPTC